jgi:hypothetical protein
MFKQRIFSIAVDYEDNNDWTMLRPGQQPASHLSVVVLNPDCAVTIYCGLKIHAVPPGGISRFWFSTYL